MFTSVAIGYLNLKRGSDRIHFKQHAATLGSREIIQRDYPNGVAQSPDVHGRAALVLNEGLVRGQGGFVKPRWGLDCVRCGNPGRAAIAATLGFGMQRRWRKNLFIRTRPVGRCHSIPCDGAFDVHGDAVGNGRISCGPWHIRQRR